MMPTGKDGEEIMPEIKIGPLGRKAMFCLIKDMN
jgi:hypothetical protein